MKSKDPVLSKTELRAFAQYRDRWSGFGESGGIESISDKLTPEQLRRYPIFEAYDDKVLERISPDVSVARWKADNALFEEGTYIDLAFWIAEGEVEVQVHGIEDRPRAAAPIFDGTRTAMVASPPTVSDREGVSGRSPSSGQREITLLATMDFDLERGEIRKLAQGDFFGEIGALSGWPQSVSARTATDCTLVQIRLPALRLMRQRSKDLKARLDERYRQTSLAAQLRRTPLFSSCPDPAIDALCSAVELVSCNPGEAIVEEGSAVEAVYLLRSGFVRLAQGFGEGRLTVSYLSKGMTFGDAELVAAEVSQWEADAISVEYAELVKIPAPIIGQLADQFPEVARQLWDTGVARLKEYGHSRRTIGHAEFTEVALESGLVEGNSILAIDLDLCTRCDDCVRACADTHGGRPRFVREGNKYENVLIAKSCYHCQDPVCLVGCPTGAIHRAGTKAVVEIDDPVCIGCSSCANNCPYDAIVMHETGTAWPEDMIPSGLRGKPRLLASKCDLCADTGHGPACVSNCPQGCAFRVESIAEFEDILKPKG